MVLFSVYLQSFLRIPGYSLGPLLSVNCNRVLEVTGIISTSSAE
jgi:hypothetical protein